MVTPLFDVEAYWRARREAEARVQVDADGVHRCEWCGISADEKPVGGFGPVIAPRDAGAVLKQLQASVEVMVETLCRTCAFWLEKAALPTFQSDAKDWTVFRFWLARGIETDPNWQKTFVSGNFTHLTAIATHGQGGFGGGCYVAKFVRSSSKNSPLRYGFWHLPGVWSQGQPEDEAAGNRVLQYPRDTDPKVSTSYLIDANGKTIGIDPRPIASELFACPGKRPCTIKLEPVLPGRPLAVEIEAMGWGKVLP